MRIGADTIRAGTRIRVFRYSVCTPGLDPIWRRHALGRTKIATSVAVGSRVSTLVFSIIKISVMAGLEPATHPARVRERTRLFMRARTRALMGGRVKPAHDGGFVSCYFSLRLCGSACKKVLSRRAAETFSRTRSSVQNPPGWPAFRRRPTGYGGQVAGHDTKGVSGLLGARKAQIWEY